MHGSTRAMLRDGQERFSGSMSIRAIELDKRRESALSERNERRKAFPRSFEQDGPKQTQAEGAREAEAREKDEKNGRSHN